MINDRDWRGTEWQQSKVQWALDQWEWSASKKVSHHIFMTDDLHLAPRFWGILMAMVVAAPDMPIGLLSNHPHAATFLPGHWYRTNSWLVGPAYVLPHAFLVEFLQWFKAKPDGSHLIPGTKAYGNDDSTLNEFVTMSGRMSAHPVPTIVEHRGDLESTVGHGDRYSRERVSWRAVRWPEDTGPDSFEWREDPADFDIEAMTKPAFWAGVGSSPILKVGA